MPAPLGNNNGGKGKAWLEALRRADLSRERLTKVAEKVWELAEAGEQWAILEIGNRFDGKAAQSLTVSGDAENPLAINWPLPKPPLEG